MEETDVSVPIYSFLDVTAVCYDKIKTQQRQTKMGNPWYQEGTYVLDNSSEVTSQRHNGLHDISSWNIYSLESQYSVYSVPLKVNISFKHNLRSDM